MWCDVIWCDVMWHDVMWCDMMWHDVMWCDVTWCDVMWCDMMWHDVMWCDMMWCDVMCCAFISGFSANMRCSSRSAMFNVRTLHHSFTLINSYTTRFNHVNSTLLHFPETLSQWQHTAGWPHNRLWSVRMDGEVWSYVPSKFTSSYLIVEDLAHWKMGRRTTA